MGREMAREAEMESLDEIVNTSKDVREVKRALSVKMVTQGIAPATVSALLNVSPQDVSQWKGKYEEAGAAGLEVGYRGSESYLTPTQREAVVTWIAKHETLSVEAVRDHLEAEYGVMYQSKQSYYDLLEAGGMSYHKSQPPNPKRDEEQVQARREEIKKNWHQTGKRSSAVR